MCEIPYAPPFLFFKEEIIYFFKIKYCEGHSQSSRTDYQKA